MASSRHPSKTIPADDDYMLLERLSVALTSGTTHEQGTFTLCFWIYVMRTTTMGVVIRQGRPHAFAALPFLTIDDDRKLTLHPLPPPLGMGAEPGGGDAANGDLARAMVVSDQPCPIDKWVHIGCEVGPDVARLHIDGTVVGQRQVSFPAHLGGVGGDSGPVLLSGGDGSATGGSVHGYAHYVRLLPRPTQNPPLELSLDGSAADDSELEEGGDGVWSVVGGKASCRRNFALDIALLDALGRAVHRDMEVRGAFTIYIPPSPALLVFRLSTSPHPSHVPPSPVVATLVYADDGSPVQRQRDDAESPLLTTCDGVEFPSCERPVRLVHGRASFKLKISMLSSKCDNRLFRVLFDALHTPRYPFMRVVSRPIRCVSRNRNHRPNAASKRPAALTLTPTPTPDDHALTHTPRIEDLFGDEPHPLPHSHPHHHYSSHTINGATTPVANTTATTTATTRTSNSPPSNADVRNKSQQHLMAPGERPAAFGAVLPSPGAGAGSGPGGGGTLSGAHMMPPAKRAKTASANMEPLGRAATAGVAIPSPSSGTVGGAMPPRGGGGGEPSADTSSCLPSPDASANPSSTTAVSGETHSRQHHDQQQRHRTVHIPPPNLAHLAGPLRSHLGQVDGSVGSVYGRPPPPSTPPADPSFLMTSYKFMQQQQQQMPGSHDPSALAASMGMGMGGGPGGGGIRPPGGYPSVGGLGLGSPGFPPWGQGTADSFLQHAAAAMGGGGGVIGDASVAQAMAEAAKKAGPGQGIPDRVVFKYCLEGMACRALFLKLVVLHKSDEHMAVFAARVAQCTGCRHNGYQIAIAKRLLHDANEVWQRVMGDAYPVRWTELAVHLEEHFMDTSGCRQRPFSPEDKNFMRRIAGCSDFITKDQFERLWHWLYPIALTLAVPQLRSAWESDNPRWLVGMVSREDAESMLCGPQGLPSKPGTFLLRFASSRTWPHPDAGALVVSYSGKDGSMHHKLLTVDDSPGLLGEEMESGQPPLAELLLSQPELSQLCRSVTFPLFLPRPASAFVSIAAAAAAAAAARGGAEWL
eukprot:jgi/Mesen1/4300/ME000022S03588